MESRRLIAKVTLPVIAISLIGCQRTQAKRDQVLVSAINAGSSEGVRDALAKRADPNASIDDGKNYPLLLAIGNTKITPKTRRDIVGMLLGAGADPAKQQKDGFDVLMVSASAKDAELCSRFCDMGISPMRRAGNGVSAFHLAAMQGDVDSLRVMLPFIKADQIDNPMTSDHVASALELACLEGHLESARLLLEHHANPNFQGSLGVGPLVASVHGGSSDLVNLLLEHGAQVDLPLESGTTALSSACLNGRLEIARILIAHGAGINHQSKDGTTPMMCAAGRGHDDVVELLVKSGAREDLRDKKGRTAADYAKVHKSGSPGPAPESAGG